jgi:phage gpG-like protein
MPAFHSVVSVLVKFAVKSFSTNSRPALRQRRDGHPGADLTERQADPVDAG